MARTRGIIEAKKSNSSQSTRNFQNVTAKIQPIVMNMVTAFNDKANQNIQIGINKLKDISEIVIRGEVVLNSLQIAEGQVPGGS